MIEKEVKELRRRFRYDKSDISCVRGCFVNEKGEIVTQFRQSFAAAPVEETEAIFAILKKTLSGTLGTNLLNMEFSTKQVLEGEEHALLMSLRDSHLEDEDAVNALFQHIAGSLSMDGNYVILLAYEDCDIFSFRANGEKEEDSSEVYSYFLCSICPVKASRPALSFHAYDNSFHTLAADSILTAPQVGFLFPAFDNRCANIHAALYYTHDITDNHEELIDELFKTTPPAPAAEQKEAFRTCLSEAVADACDFEVVKSIHEQISDMVAVHKETKQEEPLTMSRHVLETVLSESGVDEEHVEVFSEKITEAFGEDAEVCPQNIVNTRQFELKLPDISIKVNPERKDLITTQVINGTKYILINAAEGVEVNGVPISIQ